MIDRRRFVAAAAATTAAACMPVRAAQQASVRPEQFGARGDGRSDDTAALQRCVDAVPPGVPLELRSGAVYRVDTNYRPTRGQFGGVRLKNGIVLKLDNAELKALPSRSNQGCVLNAHLADGWRIEGPGRITGERDIHMGRGGEWGMGVACFAAREWSIGPGVEISNCWGDGIYLGYSEARGDFCENYRIDTVHIHDCRRCGIGHVAGRNGQIVAAQIHNIGGTGPAAGIDFEADYAPDWNRNIVVSGARIYDCEIGIDISTSSESITITGSDISGRNSGLIIGKPVRNIRIVDNPSIASKVGGLVGGAIRTVVYGESGKVSDVYIAGNQLYGGGKFVLDIVGDAYQNFVVERNDVHASNAGVQGVARLGSVTFVGNRCFIEGQAGKAGDYFLYIAHGNYGSNVYTNATGIPMHSIAIGGRDLGGDRYEAQNLTRIRGR